MIRVWIAQCLCPQRHCIMATAGEAANQTSAEQFILAPLKRQVELLLRERTINSWCGLCRAEARLWHFEVARSRFATLAEALPLLKASEAEQAATAAVLGDMPRSD